MNFIKNNILALFAIVIAVICLSLVGGDSAKLGGTTNYDTLSLSDRLYVGNTVSSTAQIGAASKSGCLIVGDSANGASPVYITATGATVTASTTKPTACQTAN